MQNVCVTGAFRGSLGLPGVWNNGMIPIMKYPASYNVDYKVGTSYYGSCSLHYQLLFLSLNLILFLENHLWFSLDRFSATLSTGCTFLLWDVIGLYKRIMKDHIFELRREIRRHDWLSQLYTQFTHVSSCEIKAWKKFRLQLHKGWLIRR